MESRGRISNIAKDYISGKLLLTVELLSVNDESLQQVLHEQDLAIEIKKYREKRSKDANAYFHVLVNKIADSWSPPISKAKCKNIMIGRYGQPEYADGAQVLFKTQMGADILMEQENLHFVPCGAKVEDNGTHTFYYWLYRGSHTYNSKEMATLIDGTVQEAKALGIDTATPDEIARLKELWREEHG